MLYRKFVITCRKPSCGKVMLLHLSLSHSVHGGIPACTWVGVCASQHAQGCVDRSIGGVWTAGVDRSSVDKEGCVDGVCGCGCVDRGVYTGGVHIAFPLTHSFPLPPRWPLKRMVRILLKCILVYNNIFLPPTSILSLHTHHSPCRKQAK